MPKLAPPYVKQLGPAAFLGCHSVSAACAAPSELLVFLSTSLCSLDSCSCSGCLALQPDLQPDRVWLLRGLHPVSMAGHVAYFGQAPSVCAALAYAPFPSHARPLCAGCRPICTAAHASPSAWLGARAREFAQECKILFEHVSFIPGSPPCGTSHYGSERKFSESVLFQLPVHQTFLTRKPKLLAATRKSDRQSGALGHRRRYVRPVLEFQSGDRVQ